MSNAEAGAGRGRRRGLPDWARPLVSERVPAGRRSGRLRRVESIVLIVLGLALTVVTVHDVVRHVGIEDRLTADVYSWRHITGHYYLNLTTENGEETGHGTRDVTCANVSYGPPGARTQLCLIFTGPDVDRRRRSRGGYYLPAYLPDREDHRYGCFGTAVAEHLCPP